MATRSQSDAGNCNHTLGETIQVGTDPVNGLVENGKGFGGFTCHLPPEADGGFILNGGITVEPSGQAFFFYNEDLGGSNGEPFGFSFSLNHESADCVMDYSDPGRGIGPSHVWGKFDCTTKDSTYDPTEDPTKVPSCHMTGEFHMENCGVGGP